MKILTSILLTLLSLTLNAQEVSPTFSQLYFSVASSGSGGGIMGHAFLTFCPDSLKLELEKCHALEYNLEINLGSKYEELLKQNFLKKIKMFQESSFRVYEYKNAKTFSKKYLDRGQALAFYQFNGDSETINEIYQDILAEKADRDANNYNDYAIRDNNCVTKAMDAINRHSAYFIAKQQGFFDLDSYVNQFPIFVEDSLIESHLFEHVLVISKDVSYSKRLFDYKK